MRILILFLLFVNLFILYTPKAYALNLCKNERIDPESNGQRNTPDACPTESICYTERTAGGQKVIDCFKAAAAGTTAAKITGFAYGIPCATSLNGKTVDPGTIRPADAGGDSSKDKYDGFMTAVGCVPSKPDALVNSLIKYASFAAGGIAFLLMILAALQMITAEGNPESIKKAQEKFYSAIIGLLLIIFSVLLMQVIGVDILGLPGFGKQ